MSNLDLIEQLSLTPTFKSEGQSVSQLSESMSEQLRINSDNMMYADINEVVRLNHS